MRKLVKATFHFREERLNELRKLSERTSVPRGIFVREALDYILKKYRYLLTMKFNPEEARYLRLTGRRDVDPKRITEGEPSLSSLPSKVTERRSPRDRLAEEILASLERKTDEQALEEILETLSHRHQPDTSSASKGSGK